MAEMTAEKAVEWLTSDKAFGQECYSRKQLAALIQQQAQEIERLRLYRGCLDCRFNDSGVINNCLCHGKNCIDFDKWLEKEAQGVE